MGATGVISRDARHAPKTACLIATTAIGLLMFALSGSSGDPLLLVARRTLPSMPCVMQGGTGGMNFCISSNNWGVMQQRPHQLY